MSKITKKQLLQDVRTEIEFLKTKLTQKERERLNFRTFNSNERGSCIYGQISGDCRNERAKDLIQECCKRVWHQYKHSRSKGITPGSTFTEVRSLLNGGLKPEMIRHNLDFISALEGYIQLKGAKNKEIIDYLKGKTEILSL